MHKILLISLLITSFLFAIENNMGSTGYVRIQATADEEKESVCFKANGATTKYRLGNECETWMELAVTQDLKFDNGIVVHNQVRPTFLGENGKQIDLLRWDEVYSEISNIFDNSVSFWIGRRFYKRYDSHLSDYWFLNMSGDGIGVNNLDLGEVSLSYSFMFNDMDPESLEGNEKILYQSHDIRFEKKVERGKHTLFLNYMVLEDKSFDTGEKIQRVDGYAVGLLYEDTQIFQELFKMKGNSISGIFYGTGAARGAGAYSPYYQEPLIDEMLSSGNSIENSKTFRLINYNSFENSTFGIMSNLVYEYKDNEDFSDEKQDWYSAGIRPYWFVNRYSRLLMELGYDYVKDRVDDDSNGLTKLTTAVEFALEKGIWKRPVLRFYYTHASWSSSAEGEVGTEYYSDATSGNIAGVQLEYWW